MARRKNRPEMVKVKWHLSEHLREIRSELFGERGGSEMARRLGIPIRTWYNYESGVTVPAEVLLRFMELTGVEPLWLLHGQGQRYRSPGPMPDDGTSVEALLRTALRRLEGRAGSPSGRSDRDDPGEDEGLDASSRGWLAARRSGRCLSVRGDAMAPIVADGAEVAYSDAEEDPDALEGALVVARVEGEDVVRWFRRSGRYGLLRAEKPDHVPSIMLLDLDAPASERFLRRVVWISTPH